MLSQTKILVIGCPGSGKSTFARKLRDKTGLPLYYLDMLFHRPDRSTADRETFDSSVRGILSRESWIIDGNYQRTLPMRFEQAELIFLFDLPVEECLEGALSRVGSVREDMPWVETEFDPDFRQYIIDFPRDQLPAIRELIMAHRGEKEVVVFKSRLEADAYLNSLGRESSD